MISKIKDYILVFLLMCISGNPLFIYSNDWVFVIAVAVMVFLYMIQGGERLVSKKILGWLIFFVCLFVGQALVLKEVSLPANVNFLAKFYVGYLIVTLIGFRFRRVYLKTLYVISLISLVLFLWEYLGGAPLGFEFNRYKTLIFYNSIISIDPIRNSGMFWEPGAFQGFIMLIPLLYLDDLKHLWRTYRKECIIFIITLGTTQSTTGYLVFVAFALGSVLISEHLSKVKKSVIIISSILLGMVLYDSLEFLGEKVSKEYEAAIELEEGEVSWSRMGALTIDMKNIARHPIVGNGFLLDSRYEGLGAKMVGTGNGFSGAINIMGVVCILLYFVMLYRQLNMPWKKRLLFLVIIVLLLNGEYFLNYPLFWGLLFVKLPFIDKSNNESNSRIINCPQS